MRVNAGVQRVMYADDWDKTNLGHLSNFAANVSDMCAVCIWLSCIMKHIPTGDQQVNI